MKLMPFTYDLCQQLLDAGYCNFVTRFNSDGADEAPAQKTITLEAVREKQQQAAIPIEEIMKLPEYSIRKYYVMLKD